MKSNFRFLIFCVICITISLSSCSSGNKKQVNDEISADSIMAISHRVRQMIFGNNDSEAMQLCIMADSLAKLSGNKALQAQTKSDMALYFNKLPDLEKSREYFLEAIAMYEAENDTAYLNQIAECRVHVLRIDNIFGNKTDEMISMSLKSLDDTQKYHFENASMSSFYSYLFLFSVYHDLNKADSAKWAYDNMLQSDFSKEKAGREFLPAAYITAGEYDKALEIIDEIKIEYAKTTDELSHNWNYIASLPAELECYKQLGNKEKAAAVSKECDSLKTAYKLYTYEQQTKVLAEKYNAKELEYKLEKKELENLRRINIIVMMSIMLTVCIVGLFIIFRLYFTTRKQSAEIDQKNKVLSEHLDQLLNAPKAETEARRAKKEQQYEMLEKAAAMLREHPEYTVEGIATECGFGSRATFYRLFNEHFGISPKEYREH